MLRRLSCFLALMLLLGRPASAGAPGALALGLGYAVPGAGLAGALADPAMLDRLSEGLSCTSRLIPAYPVVHDQVIWSLAGILPARPHPVGLMLAGYDGGFFCAVTGVLHVRESFFLGGRLGAIAGAPALAGGIRPYGAAIVSYAAGPWSLAAGYDGSVQLRALYTSDRFSAGCAYYGEPGAVAGEKAAGVEYRAGPFALRTGLASIHGLWYYTTGLGFTRGDWHFDLSWRQELLTPEFQAPVLHLTLGTWR